MPVGKEPFKQRALPALAGCMLALASWSAAAAPVESCDPAVMEAAWSKAQAKLVQDLAVTKQAIPMPDSTLTMTCFNIRAAIAKSGTAGGGSIFSGDLGSTHLPAGTNNGYQTVIEDALNSLYPNFTKADGNVSTVVDYTQTALPASLNPACPELEDLKNRRHAQGVLDDVPYMTEDDLLGAQVPAGATEEYQNEITLDAAAFANYGTAQAALPLPVVPAFTVNPTSTDPVCDQLLQAGVVTSCP